MTAQTVYAAVMFGPREFARTFVANTIWQQPEKAVIPPQRGTNDRLPLRSIGAVAAKRSLKAPPCVIGIEVSAIMGGNFRQLRW